MAKATVSSDFSKFQTKNASALDDARKAENNMMSSRLPVGWKGEGILVDAVADKTKDRKDEKGQTKEGAPYVRFEFQAINDEEYAGEKASKTWIFNDTANATATDRYMWFLNDLENLGLDPEVRRDEETTMEDILNHFLQADNVYAMEMEPNSFRRDKKELSVVPMVAVDESSSMSPDEEGEEKPLGDTVKFMGKEWEVLSKDGNTLTIKSPKTGAEREVAIADLDD